MSTRNFYINAKENYLERMINNNGYTNDPYYDLFKHKRYKVKFTNPLLVPFTGNAVSFVVKEETPLTMGFNKKQLKREHKLVYKKHEPLRDRFCMVVRYDNIAKIKKDGKGNYKLVIINKLVYNLNWFSRIFFMPYYLFSWIGDAISLFLHTFFPRFRKSQP